MKVTKWLPAWLLPAKKVVVEPALTAGPKKPQIPYGLTQIIRPQAAGRWLLPSLAEITPTYIENILRGAFGGSHVQQWELFDLMEDTWPRLAKNLNEVKMAVSAMDWVLHPWQEEGEQATDSAKERVRLVNACVKEMRPDVTENANDFSGTIYDLLDSWGKGTSVLEIDWEQRKAGKLGDITAPRCTRWVHPNNYAWSEEGWLGLVPRTDVVPYSRTDRVYGGSKTQLERMPEYKFLIAICKGKTGHPLSTALLRTLAWWWCAANFGADWLLNLSQLFGLPFRWANYPDNASDELINKIATMLENMGSAGWAAFPAGTSLELKEASKTGDSSPQADLIDRADKQADLLILRQTLTSDVGDSGSRALGDVHASVKDEVVQAAADFSACVLNRQLIPAILQLNYGDEDEAPYYEPERDRGEGSLSFKREVLKGFMSDGTVVDILANLTDLKTLCKEVGLPVNEEYIDPYVPVQDAQGRMVTGETMKDSEGDVVGAEVEEQAGAAQAPGTDGTNGPDEERTSALPEDKPTDGKETDGASYAARSVRSARLKAAAARIPPAEMVKALEALASDLQPIRERFGKILQIEDDAIFVEKLKEFLGDLDKLAKDVTADPKFARELQRLKSSALAIGMSR